MKLKRRPDLETKVKVRDEKGIDREMTLGEASSSKVEDRKEWLLEWKELIKIALPDLAAAGNVRVFDEDGNRLDRRGPGGPKRKIQIGTMADFNVGHFIVPPVLSLNVEVPTLFLKKTYSGWWSITVRQPKTRLRGNIQVDLHQVSEERAMEIKGEENDLWVQYGGKNLTHADKLSETEAYLAHAILSTNQDDRLRQKLGLPDGAFLKMHSNIVRGERRRGDGPIWKALRFAQIHETNNLEPGTLRKLICEKGVSIVLPNGSEHQIYDLCFYFTGQEPFLYIYKAEFKGSGSGLSQRLGPASTATAETSDSPEVGDTEPTEAGSPLLPEEVTQEYVQRLIEMYIEDSKDSRIIRREKKHLGMTFWKGKDRQSGVKLLRIPVLIIKNKKTTSDELLVLINRRGECYRMKLASEDAARRNSPEPTRDPKQQIRNTAEDYLKNYGYEQKEYTLVENTDPTELLDESKRYVFVPVRWSTGQDISFLVVAKPGKYSKAEVVAWLLQSQVKALIDLIQEKVQKGRHPLVYEIRNVHPRENGIVRIKYEQDWRSTTFPSWRKVYIDWQGNILEKTPPEDTLTGRTQILWQDLRQEVRDQLRIIFGKNK